MKLSIVIHSSDAEVVWNAFRLGNFALKEKDQVKVFLLAKGVEVESSERSKEKNCRSTDDTIPSKKQPTTLTSKVAKGNE